MTWDEIEKKAAPPRDTVTESLTAGGRRQCARHYVALEKGERCTYCWREEHADAASWRRFCEAWGVVGGLAARDILLLVALGGAKSGHEYLLVLFKILGIKRGDAP